MKEYIPLIFTFACGFLGGMGLYKELRRPRKPFWPVGRANNLPSNRKKPDHPNPSQREQQAL